MNNRRTKIKGGGKKERKHTRKGKKRGKRRKDIHELSLFIEERRNKDYKNRKKEEIQHSRR